MAWVQQSLEKFLWLLSVRKNKHLPYTTIYEGLPMKNNASIPNPYLQPLSILVGEWSTVGSHPFFPNTKLHGRTVFEWIEGGAFLKMSSTINHPEFPDGLAIFGSDNESGEITMLYFDERGVSRKQNVEIEGNHWKWWRDNPSFSQRFTVTIEHDGNTMTSNGEMRRENAAWENDLGLSYTRLEQLKDS
jgi:hypothetical protein